MDPVSGETEEKNRHIKRDGSNENQRKLFRQDFSLRQTVVKLYRSPSTALRP
jgi:hypothetical protein